MVLRIIIAVYMSTVFGLQLYLQMGPKRNGKFCAFEISNISFAIQLIYYWISCVSLNETYYALGFQLMGFSEVLDVAICLEAR